MGGKQPSTTTQISEVKLPEWVEKASEQNYNFAKDIANDPNRFYEGPRVAGMGGQSQSAIKGFNQDNRDLQAYGRAGNVYGALSTYNAPQVTAGQLAGTDLDPYMNPYVDNVVNRTMDNVERQRQLALMGNADKAQAAKAFGGSRSAIIDAITNAETARQAGDVSAGLYKDAYDSAREGASFDIGNRLAAAQGNQNAALQSAGIRLNAGQGQQSLGDAYGQRRNTNFAVKNAYGLQQQQLEQRRLDARREKFDEKNNARLDDLNIRLSALGMSPYGKSESTTATRDSGGGTDFASVGAGFLSLLPMLFGLSDETEKTDIQKVGRDSQTGLDLYAFRYKGDPKTYPKVIGPMAQDIERKFPSLVKNVGGKKVVLGMGRKPKKVA